MEGKHQSSKQPATQTGNVGVALIAALYVAHFEEWTRISLDPLI